jgi:uncharacterized membrane protein YtjA (UPF0391 family)
MMPTGRYASCSLPSDEADSQKIFHINPLLAARLSVAQLLICLGQAQHRANVTPQRRYVMLHYALVFLVVALIAAALGFGGIAGAAAGVAKILFVIFLVLFVASLVAGGLRRF